MLPVQNNAVWRQTRILFLGSALLFLVNIYFGFDNALTVGVIPHWQSLIHLHAGAIGWITLSFIGLALWVFTGQREVSDAYARRTGAFVWLAVVVFAGYIASFGLAFAGAVPFFLLPTLGTAAMLIIWAAAIFALSQLRHQPVVSTVHLLVAGGLLVAGVGATMGVLLGLERIVGQFLTVAGSARTAVHTAMMDGYLILVAGGIVEWVLHKGASTKWTWPGLAQALAWTVAAILVPFAFLLNLLSVLTPIFALLLVAGLLLFLGRVAWRAIGRGPLGWGVDPWAFFGTLWLLVFVGLLVYAAAVIPTNPSAAPNWFSTVFVHTGFVGMMTNLLLGVFSASTQRARGVAASAEPAALWLMNLGLPVFFGLYIATGSRLGAIVMGLGVLLGIGTMIVRLLLSDLRWAYDFLYRERAPWEMNGPREELVEMVERGRLKPCRAIDLGCGTGDNVIYLAQHGFDAVGVDLSPRAIAQAREKARAAGVAPTFVVGDVTDLQRVEGPFDLVLDYGCLGCVVGMPGREQYAQTLIRLTRPGAQYILLNFAARSEKRFNLLPNMLRAEEVDRLFGDTFEVEAYERAHQTGPFGMTVEFRRLRRA